MILNLGPFGVELARAPRPGSLAHVRYGRPRRFGVIGRYLTPAEAHIRDRVHQRRMRRAGQVSFEAGPLALHVYRWNQFPPPTRVEVQGDGIIAFVEGEEWISQPTRVVWVPVTGSLVPELHLHTERLDDHARSPDPTSVPQEFILERAAIGDPPRRYPPFPSHGYPSVLAFEPGYWRFTANWGNEPATLIALIDPPLP